MIEVKHYYAVRVCSPLRSVPFLARQNASAPALFWFHEDAVKHREKCGVGCDIVKVLLKWNTKSPTYNEPGDMFHSAKEIRRRKSTLKKQGAK